MTTWRESFVSSLNLSILLSSARHCQPGLRPTYGISIEFEIW